MNLTKILICKNNILNWPLTIGPTETLNKVRMCCLGRWSQRYWTCLSLFRSLPLRRCCGSRTDKGLRTGIRCLDVKICMGQTLPPSQVTAGLWPRLQVSLRCESTGMTWNLTESKDNRTDFTYSYTPKINHTLTIVFTYECGRNDWMLVPELPSMQERAP